MTARMVFFVLSLTSVCCVKPLGAQGSNKNWAHAALESQSTHIDEDVNSVQINGSVPTAEVMNFKQFIAAQSDELDITSVLEEYEDYKKSVNGQATGRRSAYNCGGSMSIDAKWRKINGGSTARLVIHVKNLINYGSNPIYVPGSIETGKLIQIALKSGSGAFGTVLTNPQVQENFQDKISFTQAPNDDWNGYDECADDHSCAYVEIINTISVQGNQRKKIAVVDMTIGPDAGLSEYSARTESGFLQADPAFCSVAVGNSQTTFDLQTNSPSVLEEYEDYKKAVNGQATGRRRAYNCGGAMSIDAKWRIMNEGTTARLVIKATNRINGGDDESGPYIPGLIEQGKGIEIALKSGSGAFGSVLTNPRVGADFRDTISFTQEGDNDAYIEFLSNIPIAGKDRKLIAVVDMDLMKGAGHSEHEVRTDSGFLMSEPQFCTVTSGNSIQVLQLDA